MIVEASSTWRAGAIDAAGKDTAFDSPKCLLRWLSSERGRGARGAWVTEYYTQRRIEIASAHFVIGSDVLGPMGADLVPVQTQPAAQRFLREHHGARILDRAAVTPDVLQALR